MRRPNTRRRAWLPVGPLLLLALGLNPLTAWADGLTAKVSPAAADGTLELTLEAPRAPMAEPDLTAVRQHFEVLGTRSQNQSFMVNGRRSDSFSLILTLRPRHEGVAEVPPIPYGDETTPSLRLDVAIQPQGPDALPPPSTPRGQPERPQHAAEETPLLLLEVEATPKSVRVQQQVVLRARVMAPASRSATMARPRIAEPKITGASLIPLREDSYRTDHAGAPFEVYERRYALFPTQAGTLTIPSLSADAWAGGPGVTTPVQHQAASEPVTLQVEPSLGDLGPGQTKRPWLPARAVSLTEEQTGLARVRPGEPLLRDITLRVEGQPAGSLPQITAATPYQLTTRYAHPARWDERLADGIVGNRRERMMISGNEPGLYRLPEVHLDWWNTATGTWEVVKLPGRDVQIMASAAPLPPPADPTAVTDQTRVGFTSGSNPTAKQDHADAQGPETTTTDGSPLWPWALLALVSLALPSVRQLPGRLLGMALGRLSAPRRHPIAPPVQSGDPEPRPDPMAEAIAQVRTAYQASNPEAARLALLAWAQMAWRHDPPGNLTQLALRCPEPARGRITLLDQAFFSPDPLDWTRDPVSTDLPAIAAAALDEPPPPPPKRRLGPRQPPPTERAE